MRTEPSDMLPDSTPRLDNRLRTRALWISSVEGGVAWVWIALMQVFYVPYLHALGATNAEIGLGSSLPALMGGLVQLATPWALARFGSRKALVVSMALFQGLMYIPMALTWRLSQGAAIWSTIAAFSVSTLAGGIHGPAWVDWIGQLTPRRIRGRYFGARNRIFGIIQLVISVAGGLLVDRGGGNFARTMVFFSLIWAICVLFRTASSILLALQYDPPHTILRPEQTLTFRQFLRNLPHSQFGKFTICSALLNFGANFAAPFFAVYMLDDLGFSYTKYTIMAMIPTLATIVTIPLSGRLIDRVGTVRPMKFFAMVIASLSLWWVFSDNIWWLASIQVVAGLSWAAYTLSTFNYSIEIVEPVSRVPNLAYANMFNSIAIGAGAAAGGAAAPLLPVIAEHRLQTIFLVSALLRIVPAVMFQFLKQDRMRPSSLSAMEKFFFDPMSPFRSGLERMPFMRFFRR